MSYHSNLDILLKESRDVQDMRYWRQETFGADHEPKLKTPHPTPKPPFVSTSTLYHCRRCGTDLLVPGNVPCYEVKFWIEHATHGLDIHGV